MFCELVSTFKHYYLRCLPPQNTTMLDWWWYLNMYGRVCFVVKLNSYCLYQTSYSLSLSLSLIHAETHIFLHISLIGQETSGKRESSQVPVEPSLSWYGHGHVAWCSLCHPQRTSRNKINNCTHPNTFITHLISGLFILKHVALPCMHRGSDTVGLQR